MKSNPILEKKINANATIDGWLGYKEADNFKDLEAILSDFYDYLSRYYDLVDMQPGKEFLIKSFIDK